jgi:hypothetical protein
MNWQSLGGEISAHRHSCFLIKNFSREWHKAGKKGVGLPFCTCGRITDLKNSLESCRKGENMGDVPWEWTLGETVFAVLAMLIVAMSIFRVDLLLFRPKPLQTRGPDPRKYRIGYIVEEEDDAGEEKKHEERK